MEIEFKEVRIGDDVTFLHRYLDSTLSWEWEEFRGIVTEQLNETRFLVTTGEARFEILSHKDTISKIHNREL